MMGNTRMTELLLRHGADSYEKDLHSRTYLHRATVARQTRISLNRSSPTEPTYVVRAHPSCDKSYLIRNNTNDIALSIVVNFENHDCARVLIEAGACKRIVNHHGQPLFHAGASNHNGLTFLQEHQLPEEHLSSVTHRLPEHLAARPYPRERPNVGSSGT
ncbi:MAG: hypothetical protein M1831_003833 [Alyxoria varia]|nr:MAG: hypothetical protein M1831_003833 [Alyxoria varia]